jgi:hypothetical protein
MQDQPHNNTDYTAYIQIVVTKHKFRDESQRWNSIGIGDALHKIQDVFKAVDVVVC